MYSKLSRQLLRRICEDLGYDPEVVTYISIEPTVVTVTMRSPATGLHTTQEHKVSDGTQDEARPA